MKSHNQMEEKTFLIDKLLNDNNQETKKSYNQEYQNNTDLSTKQNSEKAEQKDDEDLYICLSQSNTESKNCLEEDQDVEDSQQYLPRKEKKQDDYVADDEDFLEKQNTRNQFNSSQIHHQSMDLQDSTPYLRNFSGKNESTIDIENDSYDNQSHMIKNILPPNFTFNDPKILTTEIQAFFSTQFNINFISNNEIKYNGITLKIKKCRKKRTQSRIEDANFRKGLRTIQQVKELIDEWRSGAKDSIKLTESADKLRISRKTLDDYYAQIKKGQVNGFDFEKNKGELIGYLRRYNDSHKVSLNEERKKRKQEQVEKKQRQSKCKKNLTASEILGFDSSESSPDREADEPAQQQQYYSEECSQFLN